MHCFGGQPLISVFFVAVLITLFFVKKILLLLVCTLFLTLHTHQLSMQRVVRNTHSYVIWKLRIESNQTPVSAAGYHLMER